MPGPGKKTKSKDKKPKSIASAASEAASSAKTSHVRSLEVDNEESWNGVMVILCKAFDLPDITKKSGLKRIYNNFDQIYRKLHDAYQANLDSDKIRGGIVCIFTSISVDSILSNKLIEKGFLTLLIPLLDIDSTRHLALRALVRMSHHGGTKIRTEIAKHANKLAQLLDAFPDDPRVADFAVATISHSVVQVVDTRNDGSEKPNDPAVLETLDMPMILRAVADTTKRDFPESKSILDHAIGLISVATVQASKAYYQAPQALDLLVAGMRSKDWITRCSCLSGIIRLHGLDAEKDTRLFDPNRMMAAAQRGPPDHLLDVMMDYGLMRTEIYTTLNATKDFQAMMMESVQTHDLYTLGRKIASLILRTEFSIADGMFQVEDPRTGRLKADSCGLPFTRWLDALPHCAKALRVKGRNNEDLDAADILDIKYAVSKQRIPDAVKIAKAGLERSPQCAYFYYALTLAADNVQGLKAAKQGMKCKTMTPFVRFQMMQRAVEHAGTMGLNIFHMDMPDGGKRYEEALAFLVSALDDAKTYIEEAPPDNRHMMNVGYWYLLLTILTKEKLSPDLREIQGNLTRLKNADGFSEFIGVTPPKTSMRLAQQLVIKRYEKAIKTFGPVFERVEGKRHGPAAEHTHDDLEDNLSAWVDEVDSKAPGKAPQEWSGDEPTTVNFDHVTLFRCNFCGNPSAVLKKCAGCSKSRYCDASCQKGHWPEHRTACKAASNSQ